MNVIVPPDLTPTEVRLLTCLSDMKGHSRQELYELLDDPLSSKNALSVALTYLRKKLERQHLVIASYKENGNTRYTLISRPPE